MSGDKLKREFDPEALRYELGVQSLILTFARRSRIRLIRALVALLKAEGAGFGHIRIYTSQAEVVRWALESGEHVPIPEKLGAVRVQLGPEFTLAITRNDG